MKVVKDRNLFEEEQLMNRVAAGDRQAKQRLIARVYERVANTARYLSNNSQMAEDLSQEALCEVLRSASSFRAQGCIEAWVDVIAVRTFSRLLKRSYRYQSFFKEVNPEDQPGTDDVAEQVMKRKRLSALEQLLTSLPREQRTVMVLKFVRGHTLEEVAELTKQSVNEVRYQLKKGRAKMGKRVERNKELSELFGRRVS